ncbi:MAG: YggS family pyridoxal phosphate-dependent enzyme [Alphaproteobacteria bacterium]|nr:YggS family pyridoxal phosphate-dependent enzyme [Alphaproteobacteria bacterium]
MSLTPSDPPERFDVAAARGRVLKSVAQAAEAAGRRASDISLVAVSKVQPDLRIEAMLETGQRIFGENRVQEAYEHWAIRRGSYADLQLHLIGPLQTNKAKDAVALFDVIETLDRLKLARALADARLAVGRDVDILVQVNTGDEPQKSGVAPREADAFIETVRKEFGLEPVGLMCIPPQDEPSGPHFALLAQIARRQGLTTLSMGMSSDFETAVRFGSTHVRIGSALFGDRM